MSRRAALLLTTLALACVDRSIGFGETGGETSSSQATGDGDGETQDTGHGDGEMDNAAACEGLDPEMVCVPEGAFVMGCTAEDEACNVEDAPLHEVWLSTFAIDRLEVIELDFMDCVAAGACPEPEHFDHCSSDEVGLPDDLPMDCVTWEHARAYCEWAGKRLPTEAEWEKAARGIDGRRYPWGDAQATCEYAIMWDLPFNDLQWSCGTSYAWPPGSRPLGVSPYGALDMAGNAEEWVADWHGPLDMSQSGTIDPQGPASGTSKVLRGGRGISTWDDLFTYQRARHLPDHYGPALGFRCARSH